MHPLDLSIPTTDTLEINGKSQRVTYCHNTFQYGEADNTVDGVMGDSFLRNAYASCVTILSCPVFFSFLYIDLTMD